MANKILLSRMTWREVAEAVEQSRPVLIPVGTQENQSQHNIMGMDTIYAAAVAEKAAEKTGAVVAPAMPFGGSDIFENIPGTITLRPEVQANLYEDILNSLARAGFDHMVFVNYHLGNDWPIEQACRRLKESAGLIASHVQIGKVGRDLIKDLYEGKTGVVSHGADPGTSLMLYLSPGDVRMDLAAKDVLRPYQGLDPSGPTTFKFKGSAVNMYLNMEDISAIGGFGDPTQANPELGKKVFDRVVDYVVAWVEKFKEMDTYLEEEEGESRRPT